MVKKRERSLCAIIVAIFFVVSQSLSVYAVTNSTLTSQQLGTIFDGVESIVVQSFWYLCKSSVTVSDFGAFVPHKFLPIFFLHTDIHYRFLVKHRIFTLMLQEKQNGLPQGFLTKLCATPKKVSLITLAITS